jgi:hypothetical protein
MGPPSPPVPIPVGAARQASARHVMGLSMHAGTHGHQPRADYLVGSAPSRRGLIAVWSQDADRPDYPATVAAGLLAGASGMVPAVGPAAVSHVVFVDHGAVADQRLSAQPSNLETAAQVKTERAEVVGHYRQL